MTTDDKSARRARKNIGRSIRYGECDKGAHVVLTFARRKRYDTAFDVAFYESTI